ncbi:unnamed protein product, partial [Meganyctiphanes norvegica]
VNWLLALLSIGASTFFLLMYGIQFGNEKSTKWLTSLIISFFSSVLFTQPIKIFVLSILMSAICKSSSVGEDDADEDEEDPHLDYDEEFIPTEKVPLVRKKMLTCKKIDNEMLKKMRDTRKKEKEMNKLLLDIFAYGMFIWIVMVLSYNTRDYNSFLLGKSLRNTFIHEGDKDGIDFTQVKSSDKLWLFIKNGLLAKFWDDKWYNNQTKFGLNGFFSDYNNRILGYATIRQIRIQHNTCRIPKALENITSHCSGFSGIYYEDDQNYCIGWRKKNTYNMNTDKCSLKEYMYTNASSHEGMAFWGNRDWYGGGGYVIDLKKPKDPISDLSEKFDYLQSHQWIDKYTRAVIIEFSSYNAQINLFGVSTLYAEFTPGGGISTSFKFYGIPLLQHQGNSGVFMICCEVLFVLFTVYYTIQQMSAFCKEKKNYFSNAWVYSDIAIILGSYGLIGVYIFRHKRSNHVQPMFRTHPDSFTQMLFRLSIFPLYKHYIGFLSYINHSRFKRDGLNLLRFNPSKMIFSITNRNCFGFLLNCNPNYGLFCVMPFSSKTEGLYFYYVSKIHMCMDKILFILRIFDAIKQLFGLYQLLKTFIKIKSHILYMRTVFTNALKLLSISSYE